GGKQEVHAHVAHPDCTVRRESSCANPTPTMSFRGEKNPIDQNSTRMSGAKTALLPISPLLNCTPFTVMPFLLQHSSSNLLFSSFQSSVAAPHHDATHHPHHQH